tara:strand:- start:815 stop:1438 length:624 start_codon:yes stop_codon:yes gene_type:complete
MLSKIKVYGRLARFLGKRTFEAQISSPTDAFKFLLANFPSLESHIMKQNYCVKVGDYEINETELDIPTGSQEIKIVPVVVGARKGLGRFILGAVLIGAVVVTGGAAVGFGASGGLGFGLKAGATATLGTSLLAAAGNLGIYLALSGAAQMLTPTEELGADSDDPSSFTFNGVQNTIRAGVAIPVVYGEIFTGSLVVSGGIDTDDYSG